ncbi:MAG: hypothetical protein PHY48_17395, partial [Candidatus Cloacimonetes bacterium]|nr:hypothetical protein [Candidatus Cloacimonadota bacterium]
MKSKEPRNQWIIRNQQRLFELHTEELHTEGSLTCWIGCVSRPVAGFACCSCQWNFKVHHFWKFKLHHYFQPLKFSDGALERSGKAPSENFS